MASEIRQWLENARDAGLSSEQIRKTLRQSNYSDDQINELLNVKSNTKLSKRIWIILAAIVFLFFTGALFIYFSTSDKINNTSVETEVTGINSSTDIDTSGADNAEQKTDPLKKLTDSDLRACNEITDVFQKDSCLKELLILTQDPQICITLSDPSDHSECFYNTITESHTVDICNDMDYTSSVSSLDKRYCIFALAVAHADISICDNINSADSSYDRCIDTVAAASNDISICENRGSISKKDWCIHFFAVDKQDINICKKIQTVNYMADCYWEVSMAKQDVGICDQLKIDFKEDLFMNMEIEDNVDQCYAWHAQLSPSYDIHNLLVPNENIGMCDKMLQEESKDTCYAGIAVTNQDETVCEKIVDEDTKAECYSGIE